MSQKYKITAVRCPSCGGSGIWYGMVIAHNRSVPCNWCKGRKRLPVSDAVNFADNIYTIGVGGYVYGDHDKAQADWMVRKAEAVYALIQQIPPWGLKAPREEKARDAA